MAKVYTRKGIVQNESEPEYRHDLPQLIRFKCSLRDNPASEIRVIIPSIATKEDIQRAIKHMETEAENWE